MPAPLRVRAFLPMRGRRHIVQMRLHVQGWRRVRLPAARQLKCGALLRPAPSGLRTSGSRTAGLGMARASAIRAGKRHVRNTALTHVIVATMSLDRALYRPSTPRDDTSRVSARIARARVQGGNR